LAKKISRRSLLCALPPVIAAGPFALVGSRAAAASTPHHHDAAVGHAAMVGMDTPAPGGPNALDSLLAPPPGLPHAPGRVASTP
jgi:hypothetical protein